MWNVEDCEDKVEHILILTKKSTMKNTLWFYQLQLKIEEEEEEMLEFQFCCYKFTWSKYSSVCVCVYESHLLKLFFIYCICKIFDLIAWLFLYFPLVQLVKRSKGILTTKESWNVSFSKSFRKKKKTVFKQKLEYNFFYSFTAQWNFFLWCLQILESRHSKAGILLHQF